MRVCGAGLQFTPPFLGVVGPICYDGNQNILTHDFVHRTHRNIFQTYYPVVFSDWWMDDWISKAPAPLPIYQNATLT